MAFKPNQSGNPNGRPKGSKESDPVSKEMKRILTRLKTASPQALDIMIKNMVKTLPNGDVIEDTKLAEKIIQMYFQAMKLEAEMKTKGASKDDGKSKEAERPKFTLEVVNPTTKNVVQLKSN